MLGSINRTIKEQGGQVSDGWLARLQNLATIRTSLVDNLPESMSVKALSIFDKHCKPIFHNMGLSKYYFDKYPSWYVGQCLKDIVKPMPSLAREVFPEFECEKLNSELYLNWDRVKELRKDIPYYFPSGSIEPVRWMRPLSGHITDRDLFGL